MSKRLPDTRRDSMVSRISGSSSQGSPPAPSPGQPHHHQPTMVGYPTTAYVDRNGRRYTQQEVQALLHHQAMMRNQALENAAQRELRNIQEQRARPGQDSYMADTPRMNPQAVAQQSNYHNGQPAGHYVRSLPPEFLSYSPSLSSTHPFSSQPYPSQGNSSTGRNGYTPVGTPAPLQGSDGYQFSARDIQAMARASPRVSHTNIGRGLPGAAVHQPTRSMSLDPRLYDLSAAGTSPSLLPLQSSRQAASPYLPTSTAHLGSTPLPPQYAGAKRPNPNAQDAYKEGPVPKKGMFPTVPPSRPSSAQGIVAPNQKKKPSLVGVEKDSRLNKEATRHSAHKLDMSKQKFNVASTEDEFDCVGHATAATPGYTKQMMDIKKKAIAQEKMTINQHHGNGSKTSTHAPPKPALPTSKMQAQVIDLTGEDTSRPTQRSILQPPSTPQTNKPTSKPPSYKSKRAVPPQRDLHHHALKHGVSLSAVELGTTIHSTMQAWLFHQQAIAAAHSLLDPDPATLARLRVKNSNEPIHTTSNNYPVDNTVTTTTRGIALDRPGEVSVRDASNAIRCPASASQLAPSEQNGLGGASQGGLDLHASGYEGDGSALEGDEMSEEQAHVRYELFRLAAEKGVNRRGRALWGGDARGAATWR
ncbi:Nn.00g083610.m01.CDS01 [Neocucurbitaria sp. VM-36]